MAKDTLSRMSSEEGEEILTEGSFGPGRGTPLRSLPEHSVFTVLPYEKLQQIARWAVGKVTLPGMEDDAMQGVMFAFARHAIAPGTKKKEVLSAAMTTAKRFALEEKRILGFAVLLDRKDFFDKDVRDTCRRSDDELGYAEDAADPQKHVDFVDTLESNDDEFDAIDWKNIPPKMRRAMDKAWFEVNPRVTRVVRHVLMGESPARAADLEAVAFATAQTHLRTFMSAAQAHL